MLDIPTLISVAVIALIGLLWASSKRKKTYYGQTFDVPETAEAEEPEEPPTEPMSRGKRTFAIVFLSLWLVGWTFGVYFAIEAWMNLSYGEEDFIFMTFWLAGAIPAWFFVVWILFRLLRGDDVEIHFDDD